jgi:hypothetical protein
MATKRKQRQLLELPRKFKGLWIPRAIWFAENLSIMQKVFIAEIDSLDHDDRGCTASNSYFSRFFGLNLRHVQRVIGSLIEAGIVESRIEKREANRRYLSIKKGLFEELDTNDINSVSTNGQNSVSTNGQNSVSHLRHKQRKGHDRNSVSTNDIPVAAIRNITKPKPKVSVENKEENEKTAFHFDENSVSVSHKNRINFELKLCAAIPPASRSHRTLITRIADHLEGLAKERPAIWSDALAWAQQARSCGDKPMAFFTAIVKEKTGFAASENKRLLSGTRLGNTVDEQLRRLGVAREAAAV